MRDGRIQQVDAPKALYSRPANVFVASFIGSPAMNLVEARFDGAAVELGGHRIEIPPEHRPDPRSPEIVLGIRPESFEDAAFADPSLPQIDVEVSVLEDVGADAHVYFRVDATRARTDDRARVHEQDTLIAVEGTIFTARVNPATAAGPGTRLRLAVDPTSFHYFDRASGARHGRVSSAEPAPAVSR
jgi:multiple sugar transport system ATP-binding protein